MPTSFFMWWMPYRVKGYVSELLAGKISVIPAQLVIQSGDYSSEIM